jgi:S-adenosylmethionine:tRNA ribosyltransferase-isomerase
MIQQWEVYENDFKNTSISSEESLQALVEYLERNNMGHIFIPTQIIIAPGYSYKIAKGIITNFHQPKSTLLLLVAAMIGEKWKEVYNYALNHNFRFLSYGDGCLIFDSKNKTEE